MQPMHTLFLLPPCADPPLLLLLLSARLFCCLPTVTNCHPNRHQLPSFPQTSYYEEKYYKDPKYDYEYSSRYSYDKYGKYDDSYGYSKYGR